MPDRDYYLSDSPHMADLRTKYQAHIASVLKLAGIADADAMAAGIMALETRMAQVHGSRVDSEDVHKADNPWLKADFAAKAPGMDWDAYFASAGLGAQQNYIVWQPGAITGLSALVASEPVQVWKDWATFHAIDHYGRRAAQGVRCRALRLLRHGAVGHAADVGPLEARQSRPPNGALGMVVGRLYTDKYFPAESKARTGPWSTTCWSPTTPASRP